MRSERGNPLALQTAANVAGRDPDLTAIADPLYLTRIDQGIDVCDPRKQEAPGATINPG